MKNVTISLQEDLLRQGRDYARTHHTTLNALIRDTLARRVMKKKRKASANEFFLLLDQANICSHVYAWKREELYRV